MVVDNIERYDYTYSNPDHTEAGAQALTKNFGDNSEKDFSMAPKQIVDCDYETRTSHSDTKGHD